RLRALRRRLRLRLQPVLLLLRPRRPVVRAGRRLPVELRRERVLLGRQVRLQVMAAARAQAWIACAAVAIGCSARTLAAAETSVRATGRASRGRRGSSERSRRAAQ